MRSRTDYMKEDEEDEKQAFLAKKAKFQYSKCEVTKIVSKNSEQLGMNAL